MRRAGVCACWHALGHGAGGAQGAVVGFVIHHIHQVGDGHRAAIGTVGVQHEWRGRAGEGRQGVVFHSNRESAVAGYRVTAFVGVGMDDGVGRAADIERGTAGRAVDFGGWAGTVAVVGESGGVGERHGTVRAAVVLGVERRVVGASNGRPSHVVVGEANGHGAGAAVRAVADGEVERGGASISQTIGGESVGTSVVSTRGHGQVGIFVPSSTNGEVVAAAHLEGVGNGTFAGDGLHDHVVVDHIGDGVALRVFDDAVVDQTA